MPAHLASGNERASCVKPYRNIQQAVAVQVAEFASVFVDEFNPAESMNLQTNTEQTQRFIFQRLHRS